VDEFKAVLKALVAPYIETRKQATAVRMNTIPTDRRIRVPGFDDFVVDSV